MKVARWRGRNFFSKPDGDLRKILSDFFTIVEESTFMQTGMLDELSDRRRKDRRKTARILARVGRLLTGEIQRVGAHFGALGGAGVRFGPFDAAAAHRRIIRADSAR